MVFRTCSSVSLAALLLIAPAAKAVEAIEQLAIEMAPRDAEVLFRKDKSDTSTFPLTVIAPDGQRLSGRIGAKGGFSQGFAKKPLSIKLDPGNKYQDQSRIVLNAMGVDRSVLREALAWDLIHALGMVAPKTNYTFLTVNGADRGLFFQIGWIGADLFEKAGFGGKGEMYDPVDHISCADLSLASVRDPPACWDKIFPGDGDYASLKALVLAIEREPIETFHTFAENNFHLESAINWIVVTAVTGNTTTYNDEYFLFRSVKTSKWLVIPWAYDRSFGWNYEPSLPEPEASDNENFQYYYPLQLGALNPLRDKLFNNPWTMARVEQRLRELVTDAPDATRPWSGWFTPGQMNRRIDRILARRAPYLARDPFIGPDQADIARKVEAIRYYAEARYRYFRAVTLGEGDGRRDEAGAALPEAGARVALTDGWGYRLAELRVRERGAKGRVEIKVRRGRPELAPSGISRRACVRRTWKLWSSASVATELTLEYLEESRRFSELGRRMTDEKKLSLYLRGPEGWRPLATDVNPLANTLSARLSLPAGERVWLMACQSATATAVAAR